MAVLNDEIRRFIVQALACYDTPTQVAQAVREEFGVEIERMQVAQYNAERAAAKTLARKWVDLFHATRKNFLEEAAKIPIAQQSYRLRQLQRLADRALDSRNAVLAAQLLEQAAKEVGGAYTDKRRIIGDPANPIPVQHGGKVEHVHTMADAELEAIARGGVSG